MSYGICMEGNEQAFERALHTAARAPYFREPYLARVMQIVEVGTAGGQTARGIAEFMAREHGDVDYALNTYDIPEGWSLNWSAVEQVIKDHPQVRAHVVAGGVQVAILGLLTGTFKGWKLLEETNANHGITVVQRSDD